MKCPNCNHEINAASIMGSVKSHRKTETARRNGAKGGRPRSRIAQSLAINKPQHMLGASDVRYPLSDLSGPRRCQAENCRYFSTHQGDINGFKAWLCEAHRSGTP